MGSARYKAATGEKLRNSKTVGVDFCDGETPVSLKSPLARKTNGKLLPVNDKMIDGLADAVVHDVKYSTSSRDMILDTMGLDLMQKRHLSDRISNGLKDYDGVATNITILD